MSPFKFFGSHAAEPEPAEPKKLIEQRLFERDEEEDETQVTKLFKEIDERISSSSETMVEAVSKAGTLERKLRGRKGSQDRLIAAVRGSSVPPPLERGK